MHLRCSSRSKCVSLVVYLKKSLHIRAWITVMRVEVDRVDEWRRPNTVTLYCCASKTSYLMLSVLGQEKVLPCIWISQELSTRLLRREWLSWGVRNKTCQPAFPKRFRRGNSSNHPPMEQQGASWSKSTSARDDLVASTQFEGVSRAYR